MIKKNTEDILKELPNTVTVVAAGKSRSVSEIEEAAAAGIRIVGENYLKEAEEKFEIIGNKVKWHLIGHLQRNKVKRAVRIFDMIQSLDSGNLAYLIDKECYKINKIMPVLIEVNIAKEPDKAGVLPEDLEGVLKEAVKLKNINILGLMTMGPWSEDAESLRPYFRETNQLFTKIKGLYEDILDWRYLSMGMSLSYKIAIEEGANMIRLGTVLFGPR